MSTVKKSTAKNGKKKATKIIQLNAFHQFPANTEKLIDTLWSVAQAGLWPNQNFSEKEIARFKDLIADHFTGVKNHRSKFKELMERICFAKRYVSRKRGRYISKPHDWLNILYPLGLAGTEAWMLRVNEIRTDVPEYNMGIRTFAKAVLSFIERPDGRTFHKYRKELMEQRQFDLLQVFYSSIVHIQYAA